MRILIISKFFPPENSVASLRPYSWAKHWAAAGHDVSVLTTVKSKGQKEDLVLDNELNFKLYEVDYSPFFYKLKSFYKSNIKVNTVNTAATNLIADEKNISEANPIGLKKLRKKINDNILNRGIFINQRMPD